MNEISELEAKIYNCLSKRSEIEEKRAAFVRKRAYLDDVVKRFELDKQIEECDKEINKLKEKIENLTLKINHLKIGDQNRELEENIEKLKLEHVEFVLLARKTILYLFGGGFVACLISFALGTLVVKNSPGKPLIEYPLIEPIKDDQSSKVNQFPGAVNQNPNTPPSYTTIPTLPKAVESTPLSNEKSKTNQFPATANQNKNTPKTTKSFSHSPEHLLNLYAYSLTNRDFSTLEKMYPKIDKDNQKRWLKGIPPDTKKPKKSPIAGLQVVDDPQRIVNETKVVLRATMKYCREDGTGSTDIKNYTFTQNQGMWQLDSMTQSRKEDRKYIPRNCHL